MNPILTAILSSVLTAFLTLVVGWWLFEKQQRWKIKHSHYEKILEGIAEIKLATYDIELHSKIDEYTGSLPTNSEIIHELKNKISRNHIQLEISSIFLSENIFIEVEKYYSSIIEHVHECIIVYALGGDVHVDVAASTCFEMTKKILKETDEIMPIIKISARRDMNNSELTHL